MSDWPKVFDFNKDLFALAIITALINVLIPGLSREARTVSKLVASVSQRVKDLRFNHATKPSGPPRLGEYALLFFLSKKDRINIPGDLEEEYREIDRKFGTRAARIWYYKQVITSVGPLFRKWCLRWISIAWVEEWVRRHL